MADTNNGQEDLLYSYDSSAKRKNRLITIFYGGARGTSKITETIPVGT